MSLDALKLHERKFHTRSQVLLVPWMDIFLIAQMSTAKQMGSWELEGVGLGSVFPDNRNAQTVAPLSSSLETEIY